MPDIEIHDTDRRSELRSMPYLYRVLILLGVLAAVTWGIGAFDRAKLNTEIENAQLTVVQHALDRIEREFRSLQDEMLREARALADNPRLVRALRRVRTGEELADEDLIRLLAGYDLPENGAVEVYDQQPRLIGWAGASIPLDSGPSEGAFLDVYQSSLAFDGQRHSALVIWWPVRDGIESIGAVRIMRMIVRLVPVRNEYLRNYTLDEEWSRMTQLTVRVELDPSRNFDPEESRYSRLLQGADGRTLIRVYVEPPTRQKLLEARSRRYADILYGWVTIAVLLVLIAFFRWASRPRKSESSLVPVGRFLVFLAPAILVRYALLAMDIPGRWQPGKAPLNPLFDPQHFASEFGAGIMRTSGDLLLTSLFAVVVAVLFIRSTESARSTVRMRWPRTWSIKNEAWTGKALAGIFGASALHVVIVLGLLIGFSKLVQHAVLDSTLDFFEQAGLLPYRLVLIVFSALLLLTVAVLFLSSRSVWVCLQLLASDSWKGITRIRAATVSLAAGATVVAVVYLTTDAAAVLRMDMLAVFLGMLYIVAYFSPLRQDRGLEWLHLRSVVPSVVLVSMLLYPILEKGLEVDRHLQMEQAALSFEEELDSRVLFAIGQVLNRAEEVLLEQDRIGAVSQSSATFDSLASALTVGELLSSLGTHDISLILFNVTGRPLGRFEEIRRRGTRQTIDDADASDFDLIHAMYEEKEGSGPLIEKMTGDRERFVYTGFAPFPSPDLIAGWMLIRAHPHEIALEGSQVFPRVLVPSGYYGDHYADMSLAEFQDDVMIRSFGRNFGRYSLAPDVVERLRTESTVWQTERIRERGYVTMYRRAEAYVGPEASLDPGTTGRNRTIAVRLPDIGLFDHLYYLLRITIAGLILGFPVYLFGLIWRLNKGMLPARRVHFQDKVLNAFFAVGLVTVTVTGWVGWEVVTGENERAVESWLRQHLMRVEETLMGDARGEELPYRVLERMDLDSLSSRVGLDLNVYRGAELERTSRPQLVRDRLIDVRLPVEAYEGLFFDGFRFVSVDQSLGSFYYTAGYQALTDERGEPKYVISLPTLPEQERIEEERARTMAYLFGALLLLVLVVMVTASLLANALARPIARLRAGLEAVSEGHFESIGPIQSRDEIADLVDSFNTMQEQIVDSRELLAKQERQLAWREMARQVAHEIKNPLTPMKLSIQHLRTAFTRMNSSSVVPSREERETFDDKFNRTTTTLIDQIDALARIADGFSSFGSMPQTLREPLDLNVEVAAAANLMRNETDVTIETRLAGDPLLMEGDKEALRRLFINLLKNAIQAIPDGRQGLITMTTLRLQRDDGHAWAEALVTDNGTGISKDLWDHIFVPSFSTKTSGTGLGLAIAQKTIEDLGGEIRFETEDDVGTTFRVLLRLSEH